MAFDAPDNAAIGRVLPNDLLAEQSTIGAMLISPDAVAAVFGLIRGQDFYAPKHEIIFDAIVTLFGKGEPTDVITVTDELLKTDSLTRGGGADYLHTLTSIVPTAANVEYYAEIVQEKATLRRLVEVGTKIAQSGYANIGEVDDLVNQAQAAVYQVSASTRGQEYSELEESIKSAVAEMEAAEIRGGDLVGVPTGFTELDALTHGLHPGQLVIVAARPAVGKSTLALDIARHAAIRKRKPVIFFSLEMSRSEIAMRMLSAETQIPLQNMRKGTMG
jgi:replicative DNA helicase